MNDPVNAAVAADPLVTVVENAIDGFVRSKFPASAQLEPQLDAAVDAMAKLAEKAIIVFAISKLAAKYPQISTLLSSNGISV